MNPNKKHPCRRAEGVHQHRVRSEFTRIAFGDAIMWTFTRLYLMEISCVEANLSLPRKVKVLPAKAFHCNVMAANNRADYSHDDRTSNSCYGLYAFHLKAPLSWKGNGTKCVAPRKGTPKWQQQSRQSTDNAKSRTRAVAGCTFCDVRSSADSPSSTNRDSLCRVLS